MTPGYLSVLTHDQHPGLVRLEVHVDLPDTASMPDSPMRLRYVARFNDSDAALMHAHETLKRRLLDPDAHLYRVPLECAIAAVASLDLRHREIFMDSGLPAQSLAAIDHRIQRLQERHRRRERLFETVGYIAVGLLLLNLLALLLLR